MRHALRRRRGLLSLAATALALGACSILEPKPDRSRFFVLAPIEEPAETAGEGKIAIGLGPISFPRYLERPEMVRRVGSNEVKPAHFDYWAGSLPHQFSRVLAQNLQVSTGAQVRPHPWYSGADIHVAVEVDVLRFEAAEDGKAHLAARWRLRDGADRGVLAVKESDLSEPTDRDASATAAALSKLLGDFSREVASAIESLPPRREAPEPRK